VLLGGEIAPGATALVQLVLDSPIAAATLDRFVLRDTSASRTIGGGRFLDLRAPERRRRSPERQAQLFALAETDDAEALARLLDEPPYHAELEAFARDRALGPGQSEALAVRLGLVPIGASVMLPQSWKNLSGSVIEILKAYHAD
ncbi:selenocysteine-specific translation factor, partial [Cupriavidus sp. 2MCAB6]